MNATPTPRRTWTRPKWLAPALSERVIVFTLVSVALGLLWTAATRFSRIRHEARTLSAQITRLNGEIDLMHSQWPSARTQRLASRYPAVTAALFHGQSGLTDWIRTVRDEAVPLALDAELDVLGVRTQSVERPIAIMQARLRILPDRDTDAPRPMFHRLLDFSRRLTEQTPRPDILQLSVRGSSNSVGEASAVVELWADSDTPTPP